MPLMLNTHTHTHTHTRARARARDSPLMLSDVCRGLWVDVLYACVCVCVCVRVYTHRWVSADIQERYGIASNASDAWEQNGGGTFTRRTDKAGVRVCVRFVQPSTVTHTHTRRGQCQLSTHVCVCLCVCVCV